MQFNIKREIASLVIIAGMFVAGIITYPYLSDTIPIHWNIKGEVDKYVGKNIHSVLGGPIVVVVMWVLFLILPNIDPKKEKYAFFRHEYDVIKVTFFAFMAFIYAIMIISSLGYAVTIGKVMPIAIGVLFMVLGNTMGKIRQNYFVGFKFPWTLANEEVWNRTHRLGGRLMVLAGVLTIGGAFITPLVAMIVLLTSLGSMVIITIGYSYQVFQKVKGRHTV